MQNAYTHRLLITWGLMIFLTSFGKAQRQEQYDGILPPAPNAAALGAYGDVPVSNYTGTTNISIPLATIKTKVHALDISLSYHGGGIRVAEEASWVGLGWALNAGGVITRTIRGKDDFGGGSHIGFPLSGPLPQNNSANDYNYDPSNPTRTRADYNYFYNSSLYCNRSSTLDTEPDAFYFNFCGHSGKFVIAKSPGGINALYVRLIENSDNSKFEFVPSNYNMETSKWLVTTPDGYKYQFGINEMTSANLGEGYNSEEYVSAWYLNKITAPNGESIDFTYRANLSETQQMISEYTETVLYRTFTKSRLVNTVSPDDCEVPAYTIGYGPGLEYDEIPGNPPCGSTWNSNERDFNQASQRMSSNNVQRIVGKTSTRGWILQKIAYANGEIVFGSSSRLDIKKHYLSTSPLPCKIDDITIQEKTGNTNRIIKKITFVNNQYFDRVREPSADANEKADLLYRLRLDAVVETGTISTGSIYKFSYYSGQLPPKTTCNRDYLGYYNKILGKDNDDGASGVNGVSAGGPNNAIPELRYFRSRTPIILPGANREPDYSSTLIGSLKSIQYPTGGSTEFTYELHQFAPPVTVGPQTGCGLRIREVVTKASPTASPKATHYEYTDPLTGASSGKLMSPGVYGYDPFQVYASDHSCQDYRKKWFCVKRTSESNLPLGSGAQGQAFGYTTVTIWDGSILTFNVNGKTVFNYYNERETLAASQYVNNVPNRVDPLNGALLKSTIYKRINTDFKPVASTEYSYCDTDPFLDIKAVRLDPIRLGFHSPGQLSAACEARQLRESVKFYDILCNWTRLATSKERVYDPNDITRYSETNTTFSYNAAHRQPIEVSKTLPDGSIERVYSSYPKDYSSVQTTTAIYAMANRLHMQSFPVETFSTITRPGKTESLVGGQYTHYDFVGTAVLPKRIEKMQLHQPIAKSTANFTASVSSGSVSQSDSRYYEPQMSMAYDAATQDLISQQLADGIETSFQWGYAPSGAATNAQLPVASFVNANRQQPNATNPALGNEASYIGFESDQKVDNQVSQDYWRNIQSPTGNFTNDAHTGKAGWRLGSMSGPNWGPTREFQPTRQSSRYKLSAWVKTDNGSAGNALLTIAAASASGNSLNCASCSVTIPSGSTNGKWQYIETIVDLQAVHTQAAIPITSNASDQIRLTAFVYTVNGVAATVDDLLFQPVEAQATTYTYDATTRQPTSISGADSRPTYYEYDDLQRLKLVRDHERNIIKRLTYHFVQ